MAPEVRGELLAGRYRRLRTIGVGGMARVYLAEDERLGRQVAVKQMHAYGPDDAAARFEREAKVGASLNHSNLVGVYDVVTEGESVLIVMEYVEGETLQDAIAAGGPTPDRVVEIVRDVAAALDHAHAHGVIHRDVKPANVLIRADGVAKLVDLGIASATDRTAITQSGTVLGTAAYMAPEQLSGGVATERSDVYALAALTFEALSGQKARSGRTPVEVAHQVVEGPPPDLRRVWRRAPSDAVAALERGLAREPGDRQPSAGAFADELERALEAGPKRSRRRFAPRTPARSVPAAGVGVAAGATAATAKAPTAPATGRDGGDREHGRRAGDRGPGSHGGDRRPGPHARERPPGRGRWITAALGALAIAAIAVSGIVGLGGDDSSQRDLAAERGGAAGDGQSGAQGAAGREADAGEDGEGAAGDPGSDGSGGSESSNADGPDSGASATGAPATPELDGDAGPEGHAAGSGDPVELNDRGYALMQAGRYDEAIPVLEQAVAQYPDGSTDLTYGYALYNLGRSLRLAGRPGEAVPILERRLQIPDQTATVRRELEAARSEAG